VKVEVKYLQPHPKTGILRYRRAFPAPLRPFLNDGGRPLRELKVSLGARSLNEPGAKARHDEAAAKYEAMVARATKLASGTYDRLDGPLIAYLAENYLHRHLELDDAARWGLPLPWFPFETRRDREADYEANREMLEEYDTAALLEYWRDWAVSYSQAMGYTFDITKPSFALLCRALGEAACRLWLAIDRRNDGEEAPTPDVPKPPSPPALNARRSGAPDLATGAASNVGKTFEAIALELIGNERIGIKEGVREHVRTGLRYIRETMGAPTPAALTRASVATLLDLMAQRPAKLPASERHLGLPELAGRYRERPEVPRMSPRTMEVRLSALSTVWRNAAKEGAIDEALPNPFINRSIADTNRRDKKAVGFTPDELRAYFSLAPFQTGDRPIRGRGEAIFWLPLLALFTGARPEEVAQLLVQDIFQREDDGRWVIRFTDAGLHPVKGPQTLKTARHGGGVRSFPIPNALVDLGLLDYHKYLQDAGELALFPLLRVKGKRGALYESFGGWFGEYLYEQGVIPRDAGRQPVREFRHTWTTAARASGIARDAREYLQGRLSPGRGSSDDEYGEKLALGDQIDRLAFKVDIVALVPRWRAPSP
jgi:integrase